jgi:hypothetical protein
MRNFLIKNTLLFLFAAFVFAPTADAQKQTALIAAPEKIVRGGGEQLNHSETLSFIRTELFFGRNKPDGTEVSEEEFAEFLRDAIEPEFPDGLTVLDGIGQFREASGATVREKAKVLILLYPSSAKKQSSRKIERIRRAYKTRFAQQSVLRVDNFPPARVSF